MYTEHSWGSQTTFETTAKTPRVTTTETLESLCDRWFLDLAEMPETAAGFLLEQVRAQVAAFLATPPSESLLVRAFLTRLGEEAREPFPAGQRARLGEQVRERLARVVVPAYAELHEFLGSLLGRAPQEPGVWRLPDGDAYYAYELRCQTSTGLGPTELDELGRAEIARLEREIRGAFAALGISKAGSTDVTLAQLYGELERNERCRWPAGEAGRRLVLERCEELVAEVRARLDDVFDLKPRAPVVVRATPELFESGRPSTCYPPARDGSRPGVFEANLARELAAPTWALPTLVYHEAIPGHHLQLALAQEREGLPLFRRTLVFHAYTEGWAKYAELLPWESGWNRDPYWHLGRLRAELFSTVNLRLDTGIHHRRWTRETGIQFFAEQTGVKRELATAIVDRIAGCPGQVCSYKVGLLELLALRDQAHQRRGDVFDLKQFHNAVLGHGALPLPLLRAVVAGEMEAAE